MAKKVFVGDPLSEYVNAGLCGGGGGQGRCTVDRGLAGDARPSPSRSTFDFSGYTDMALGLALLFGIVLPQNFNAPYRADLAAGFLAALAHDAVALPA